MSPDPPKSKSVKGSADSRSVADLSTQPDCSLVFETPSRQFRRTALKQFLHELALKVGRGRAMHCVITSDAKLRRLNRDFLGHDYATDVLSFPASDQQVGDSVAGGGFAGDMAISIDRARAQAAAYGHTIEEELRILMLHGTLHLAGMDHESDRGQMARSEQRWRQLFSLPGGLIERAVTMPAAAKAAKGTRA
jgi:probable rRNA maturation factor